MCERAILDMFIFFFFQAEDGIRDLTVTGVQTCALPISVAVTSLHGIPLVAAGRLSGPLQRAIHTYKYRPRPQLAGRLADPLSRAALEIGRASCRERV